MANKFTYNTASNDEPYLCMIIEPENKYRFRYVSEGGSHGVIAGKERIKNKKTFPTVKLMNYNGSNEDIFIKVSLCTEKKTEHVAFVFKEKGSSESLTYLCEDLKDDTATFKDIAILSHKKEDVHQALMDGKIRSLGRSLSRTAREKFEKDNIEDVKKEAREISNSVVLRFDAFEHIRPDVQICPPLYSDCICNQKTSSKGELKICRMSKVSGCWKGGDEIILLCEKVQKDNIKIKFYEMDGTEIRWEGYGSFSKADVHHQVAITFKTPRYKANVEKEVAVCLERDNEQSDPRYFTYLPEDCPSKKRKKCVFEDTLNILSPEETPSCSSAGISDEGSQEAMLVTLHQISQPDYASDNLDNRDHLENPTIDLETDPLAEFAGLMRYVCDTADEDNVNEDVNFSCTIDAERGEEQIDYHNYNPFNFDINEIEIDNGPAVDIGPAVDGMELLKLEDSVAFETSKSTLKNEFSNKPFKNKEEKIKKYVHLISNKDKCGNTLLHLAVIHNKSIGIIMHMNQMAKSNIVNIQNCNKQTALLIAVEKNADVVKDLLAKGADANIKNSEGNNCYHIACQNNLVKSLSYLLRYARFHTYSVNEFNNDGLTPLHLAIKNKSRDCIVLLKRYDLIDLSVKEKKCGRSLLHYAVEYSPLFIPDLLKGVEININIQDFEGNTPLHIACTVGNYDTVKLLLLAGADPTMKNSKEIDLNSDEESSGEETSIGQTPADLTTDSKILDLLKQAIKKNASDLQNFADISESERITEEVVKNLSNLLDPSMKWKDVAPYVLDEKFFSNLEDNQSPTRTIVNLMKKTHGERYIEQLQMVLSMIGLDDAVELLKKLQISGTNL